MLTKLPKNAKEPFIAISDIDIEEDALNILNSNELYEISMWSYAKEIEHQVEEMTLEQVCKELGREIKIVK